MKVHETFKIGWMAICRDIPGVLCFNADPDVQKRRRADGERYLLVAGYPFSGDFAESVVIAKSRAAIQSYIRGFNKYQSGGFANLRPVKVRFGIELISNFTPRSNLELIAAAPKLYDRAQKLVSAFDKREMTPEHIEALRAARKEAGGEEVSDGK